MEEQNPNHWISSIWNFFYYLLPLCLLVLYSIFESYIWIKNEPSLPIWDLAFALANIMYHYTFMIWIIIGIRVASSITFFRGIQWMNLVHILCWFLPWTISQLCIPGRDFLFLPHETTATHLTTFYILALFNWIFCLLDFFLLAASYQHIRLLATPRDVAGDVAAKKDEIPCPEIQTVEILIH